MNEGPPAIATPKSFNSLKEPSGLQLLPLVPLFTAAAPEACDDNIHATSSFSLWLARLRNPLAN